MLLVRARQIATFLILLTILRPAAADRGSLRSATFVDSGQQLPSATSSAVALGDVDGDSDLDAIVTNFGGPSVVFTNQGGAQGGTAGQFQDSGQALGSGQALDVEMGDLDNDGDLDAITVVDAFTGTLQIWINQGGTQAGTQGIFQNNGQTIGDNLQDSAALGTLDGDSSLDMWVTRNVGRDDKVWISDGTGQFTDTLQLLDNRSTLDVALGDVDGDGDLDSVVVGGDEDRVWINQGGTQGGTAGLFQDSGQLLGDSLSLAVSLGDLDGDLDLDVVTGRFLTNTVYLNQGGAQGGTQGVFQDSGQSVGSLFTRALDTADLDNDGDLDVFVGNMGADEVWINQGGVHGGSEGQFASNGQNLGSGQSEGVALGDVDGDGDVDAFVARWDGPNQVWLNTHNDVAPPLNPMGWQHQLVDPRGIAGKGASLVLDSQDRPHVAYLVYNPNKEALLEYYIVYAYWDGLNWQRETVARLDYVDQFDVHIGLALTGIDEPRVAFSGGPETNLQNLYYAVRDGTGWQTEIVVTGTTFDPVEEHVDLVVDGAGLPHISFARGTTDDRLHYATWDGASWQTEIVDTGPTDNGKNNAIAVDSSGQPHISYFDDEADELKYAVKTGGGWQIEVVEANDSGQYNDIVVDDQGRPHISYVSDFFDKIRYAHRDGGGWTYATVADGGTQEFFGAQTTIGIDSSDRPHVAYGVELVVGSEDYELRYARWNGTAWVGETVDGGAGLYASMALDGSDNAKIAYHDNKFFDLRYVAWDTQWQIDELATGIAARAASIAVNDDRPAVSYYNDADGRLRSRRWSNSAWTNEAVAFVGAPVEKTAVAFAANRPYIAYRNADTGHLEVGIWNGVSWSTQLIDDNVGADIDLLFAGNSAALARVAYWDASLNRIKLARFSAVAPVIPEFSTNLAGPALNANSGNPSLAVLPFGDIGVSYYDGVNGNLRYAVWDQVTDTWSDALVDGALSDAGRYNALAIDGTTGYPIIAYHDTTLAAIRLARWDGSSWQLETAVSGLTAVGDLELELGLNAGSHAQIAYIDATADEVRLARLEDGTWSVAGIAGAGQFDALGFGLDDRAHFAFSGNDGVRYAARTQMLDVPTAPFVSPGPPLGYNPLDACNALLRELFPDDSRSPEAQPLNAAGPAALGDGAIFEGMAGLFAGSAGGQHYIDLYDQHGPEMGQLGLADPALLWDSYGTLQNFMPGLEALVGGRGDELIVTQDMVDDALDIWQRLAAAGSPALAAVINAELAASNNLQDFVGLSFDEWAAAIGVNAHRAFLPIVVND